MAFATASFASAPFAAQPSAAPAIGVDGATVGSSSGDAGIGTRPAVHIRGFASTPFAPSGLDSLLGPDGIAVDGATVVSQSGGAAVGGAPELISWPPALGERPPGWVPIPGDPLPGSPSTGSSLLPVGYAVRSAGYAVLPVGFAVGTVAGFAVLAVGYRVDSAGGGTADPADVWDYILSNGKTASETLIETHTMLRDLYRIHWLEVGVPLVVAAASRTAGPVEQSVGEAGGEVTVTRLP